MAELTSINKDDKITFHINIGPKDKYKDWCIIVSSKSNYAGGFDVSARSRVLEYIYKVDKFCGKGSQTITKTYLMPGEYLAMLGVGPEELVEKRSIEVIDTTTKQFGAIMTKFDITGQKISDDDVQSAREILYCMARIFNEKKKKGETVFDNMMLDPMLITIIELLDNVANKKTISPYVDVVKNRIVLIGPTIREGKYFWPSLKDGKYVEYTEY